MVWFFGVAILILAFVRLHFGVDFTDEAYYVAVPLRFALGDRPFVDELNLTQGGFLLTYPWVTLYLKLKGSTEGLVLFTRYLYFGFLTLTSLGLFTLLRKEQVSQSIAALLSLCLLVFFPHAIPNLCYNSLAFGFLTLLLFLSWHLRVKSSSSGLFLIGIVGALLGISYVPLSLLSLAVFAKVLWQTKRPTPLLGGAAFVSALFFLIVSPTSLWNAVQYTSVIQESGSGWEKFSNILSSLFVYGPKIWILGPLALGVWFLRRSQPWVIAPFALALPLLAIPKTHAMSTLLFVNSLTIMGLALLPWVRRDKNHRDLFLQVWTPSLFAGLLTAYMSTNWSPNAAIGLFPGFLAVLLFLTKLLQTLPPRSLALAPLVVVLTIFALYQRTIFREDPIAQLTHQVTEGPFQGLQTTPKKLAYLSQLQNDLKSFETKDGHVLFYDFFPAGYLLTNMRPSQISVWRCFAKEGSDCWSYHKRQTGRSNIAVKIDRRFESHQLGFPYDSMTDPLLQKRVEENYSLKLTRENYRIYSDDGKYEDNSTNPLN